MCKNRVILCSWLTQGNSKTWGHNSIFYEGPAVHNTESQAWIQELHENMYFRKISLATMFRKLNKKCWETIHHGSIISL